MKKITVILLAVTLISGCLETTTTGSVGFLPAGMSLSPDDQIIWAGLTDEQKLAAIPYLENGGTLVSSLGAN